MGRVYVLDSTPKHHWAGAVLDNLLEMLHSTSFDEDWSCRCVGLNAGEHSVILDVLIRRSDGGPDQTWRIEGSGVRKTRILGECVAWIELRHEHPLLLPFVDDTAHLYFRGNIANSATVIGSLYRRHSALVGQWIPFAEFLNGSRSLPDLLALAHGELATGPATLLREYAAALETYGIATSMLKAQSRRHLNGEAWNDSCPHLHVLVVGQTPAESSYVIAEKFEGQRVPG